MNKSKVYPDSLVVNFLFVGDASGLKVVSEYVLLEINKTDESEKRENLLNVIVQYLIELPEVTKKKGIEFG